MADFYRTTLETRNALLFPLEDIHHLKYYVPLTRKDWRTPANASHMRPDDPVIGIVLNGKAWALPWWIQKNHHIANLDLDGEAVVMALCELCTSSGAFRAQVHGQKRFFQIRGVYRGTFFMGDHETGTFWDPFTGTAFEGPDKDYQLEMLPTWHARWDEWLERYPDTRVMYGEEHERHGHGDGQSPGSPGVIFGWATTLTGRRDYRLPYNEIVLGLQAHDQARAYALRQLPAEHQTLQDELAGEPFVILYRPGSWQARAFSRRLADRTLNFHSGPTGAITDEQTGSQWDLAGRAIAGPLAGQQLTALFSSVEEWFIWQAKNPRTRLASRADGLLDQLVNGWRFISRTNKLVLILTKGRYFRRYVFRRLNRIFPFLKLNDSPPQKHKHSDGHDHDHGDGDDHDHDH